MKKGSTAASDIESSSVLMIGSRVAYNTAKRASNEAVHQAKSEAEKVALQEIADPMSADMYRLAKQMRHDQDVMG